jgi:hypothetical protein
MSCGPPYCLGPEGTGCVPVQANGRPCRSCKCCPPECYERIDFQIRCGTSGSQMVDPPPDYFCCNTRGLFTFCCGDPNSSCPYCNCFPGTPEDQPNYTNCGELPYFNNSYLKYKKIRIDRPPLKDYHDFLGFSSDDYLNSDYYFSLKEEVQALNEVPSPGGTTCGPDVPVTPCEILQCSITTSGCCIACTPQSSTICLPQTDCGLGVGAPYELIMGSSFVIIGDGTVNINIPDPPCGAICKYINGIERSSASLKNCDQFSFYVEGKFKSFECCNCCIRTGNEFFIKKVWGAAGFREYNKNIMQKNLAEKMKKIKF